LSIKDGLKLKKVERIVKLKLMMVC